LASLSRMVGLPIFASKASARGTSTHPGRLIANLAIRLLTSAGPGVPTPIATAWLSGSNWVIASTIVAITASGVAG